MSKNKYVNLAGQLLKIEAEMRRCKLWANVTPAQQALESIQPFCVDTLSFSEWLQFIFLPKMQEIIELGLWLPSSCDVSPMAEESFRLSPINTDALINLLIECDQILNDTDEAKIIRPVAVQ